MTPDERGANWLQGAGLRPTRQRLALATLMVGDGRDRHVTAESLHQAAQAAGEPVSLATVYNTLRAFCAAGLVSEIAMARPTTRHADHCGTSPSRIKPPRVRNITTPIHAR